jgi:hypothetical protein
MALLASPPFVSNAGLNLCSSLVHLFGDHPETSQFVPGFATLGLELCPADEYYAESREAFARACR